MNFQFIKKNIALSLIIIVAIAVYVTTAYNSHGYNHPDEHYQIIEFAGLLLGENTPNDLAWEYAAKIRPTLQVIICYAFLKSFNFVNITDPYIQTFLLRLISALLAICVICYFILKTRDMIEGKTNKLIYYLLSFFLWFTPYISVRYSSEIWSGIMFLLALACFYDNSDNRLKPYKIGLILGFSFLFRFQIAFAILGFGFWLLLVNHSKFEYLLKIAAGFVGVVFIGFLIDSWFYGEFVFTPWTYFYKNVVEGVASNFGTSPWYAYIKTMMGYLKGSMGIPLVLSFIILIILKPKNIFIWCALFFIIGHSIIPHKEERFLFPIVYLYPVILIEGYILLNKTLGSRFNLKILNYTLLLIFISVNSIKIIEMAHKSAGSGLMEITKYVHDNYGNRPINLVTLPWSDPYYPLTNGLPANFYMEDSLNIRLIKNLCEIKDSLFINDAVNLLVIKKIDKKHTKCLDKINNEKFVFETQSFPIWLEKLKTILKRPLGNNILELYRYK